VQRKQEEKQLEQDINNAIAKGDLDDKDRDPKNLLQPLSQRIKRLPARDCYFTAKEAKAGNPCVVKDPAEQTTESKDDLADGWDDEDKDKFDPDIEMEDIDMVQRDHHMSQSP